MKSISTIRKFFRTAKLAVCISATILGLAPANLTAQASSIDEPSDALPVSSEHKTLGIVMLTVSRGDMASEALALGATQPSEEAVLASAASAASVLAYAEVDSLDLSDLDLTQDIKFMVAIGTPLLLESNSWNTNRLHDVVQTLFPGSDTRQLHNTGVIIRRAKGNAVTVEDADFAKVQVLAGIPEKLNFEEKPSNVSKAAINWTLRFAAKAFEATPSDQLWDLRANFDVVDVWENKNEPGYCLVAWRGSSTPGDWIRDIQSQTTKQMPGLGTTIKAGAGFVDRWVNYKARIRNALFVDSCKTFVVTGHSLGGAMAHVHALDALFDPDYDILEMRVFNSARVFNESAYNLFRQNLSKFQNNIGIYCRHGDPVNPVPFGLYRGGTTENDMYGCTLWAAKQNFINLFKNHDLSHWE